ncbi:MAG: nucleotide-binding protein [Polaromonas sp.]
MSTSKLPRVFIGSSAEALNVAYALQTSIEFDSEPTVWTQGIFQPSSFTLMDLVAALQNFDFAIFIFNADDLVTMRSQSMQAVRDNVIFELGLFMGRLGISRCFVLKARGQAALHLPSDLVGLQALEFTADRSDKNMQAALGPAAHRLRGLFAELGRVDIQTSVDGAIKKPEKSRNLERYLAIWNSDLLKIDRQRANHGLALNVIEDEAGQDTETVNRILAFLETVCDAASRGDLDSDELDRELGKTIRKFHAYSGHYFRNVMHDGDVWVSQVISIWLRERDANA